MSDADHIVQQELLATHRRTLTHLLTQQAQFSAGHLPAHVAIGIAEARGAIQRIKLLLRSSGAKVEDYPDDEAQTSFHNSPNEIGAVSIARAHALPAPVGDFVGRDSEIARLVQLLSQAAERGTIAAISGVRGMGGIGKTQLALAVAQQLALTFPDGQVLINLRGASDNPVTAAQALQFILQALIPSDRPPDDFAQSQTLYYAVLARKRVLIVADDVKDAPQIRPLLPPPGCALLITSRQRFTLPGLTELNLGILAPGEAEQLLCAICPRLGASASQLAALCGYLPLALRVSASLLANDDTLSIPRYLARLTDERTRLAQLRVADDPELDVEASLSLSYDTLEASAQLVLCQISIFPTSFQLSDAQAIVTLTDGADVESFLGLLRRRSLVDWNAATERYELHDLTRAFAQARLAGQHPLYLRLARYCLHLSDHIATYMNPDIDPADSIPPAAPSYSTVESASPRPSMDLPAASRATEPEEVQNGAIGQPVRLLSPSPSDILTFLFTDIEGSTRLWEQLPEQTRRALDRHDALLEQLVVQHSGSLVRARGEGDSRFAVFAQATDAVAAAATIQRALGDEPWPTPMPLQVRMALHTGEASQRAGDYYGSAVNRCARLRSIAHGGQILLSHITATLVRDTLPTGLQLRDLGEHRLKDLSRPERVFQLVVPGLPDDFPPLSSLPVRRTNLPVQPTPLVGRDDIMAVVSSSLRGEMRLLTLTGPGGVGKTRLALQVGAELLDDFADGVYVVSLAAISAPALMAEKIVQTLRVDESNAQPPLDNLKRYLEHRQILLILDSFEQIVAAAPQVAELLTAAPGLKLLVVSRAALRIPGEQNIVVPPLTLPSTTTSLPLELLAQSEAVALFVMRAQAVRADFQLTHENAPTVAEICRRLDGLPLAIELAAARVKVLPPAVLLSQLTRSQLKLLRGGAQDLPPHQQTLRDAIDWSYRLLTPAEQQLFSRLGVFIGGCTVEAADSVCGTVGNISIDVPEVLMGLAERSLLRYVGTADGGSSFVMLSSIYEYALERLVLSGEAEALRQQHAAFYLGLAEQADRELLGPESAVWLARIAGEHGNLRAALQWFVEQEAAEESLRLSRTLWRFWALRGYLTVA